MEQTYIYEYLGVESDPVFQAIYKLKKDQSIILGLIQVSLNKFGLYEVMTDESHECFRVLDDCYRHICLISGDYTIY